MTNYGGRVPAYPFPLQVELPGGDTIQPVKAVESGPGEALVVEWDAGSGRTVEVVSGPVVEVGRETWRVTGVDGGYLLTRGRGCGCSHPLKRARVIVPAVAYT